MLAVVMLFFGVELLFRVFEKKLTLTNPPKQTFVCEDVALETNLSEGGSTF